MEKYSSKKGLGRSAAHGSHAQKAFSLVEMLMALLVASLLMVALAPVMTKKFNETISLGGGGYNQGKFAAVIDKDTEWIVPQDAETLNIVLIGGGGAGGGATAGSQEFEETTTGWRVPANVTKLRVFMKGAGGGGASGGVQTYTQYGDIGGTAGSSSPFTTMGPDNSWSVAAGAKGNVPALDQKCKDAGYTKWEIVPIVNNRDNPVDKVRYALPNSSLVAVKACGGGGGGGGGPWWNRGGGSGGYINTRVAIPSSFSSVNITIPGGGGGGGGEDWDGQGLPGTGWGGGGGATEKPAGSSYTAAAGITPGGAGGFHDNNAGGGFFACENGKTATGETGTFSKTVNSITYQAGMGVDGACQGSLEGGGGGAMGTTSGGGGGGGGAAFFGRYTESGIDDETKTADADFFITAPGGGGGHGNSTKGGGGGGAGGGEGFGIGGLNGNYGSYGQQAEYTSESGSKLKIIKVGGPGGASPIGDSNYCAGGTGGIAYQFAESNYEKRRGESGKQGWLQVSWGPIANGVKCVLNQTPNGGGGGGAGQMWIGEITVTPGNTVNFTVGKGGAVQQDPGKNGNDGGDTSITTGGHTYAVTGGKGGKYEKTSANINSSGGTGGGMKTNDFSSLAVYNNWTGKTYSKNYSGSTIAGGTNGNPGKLNTDSGNGGKGGNSFDLDGTSFDGANGGTANNSGNNAAKSGTGGGGGGGCSATDSNVKNCSGGAGGDGYIYVEWGTTNGGGGAAGQRIEKKNVWVKSGTKLKIKIGKGGEAAEILPDSNGTAGMFGQKGADGEKTTLEITGGETLEAKGGEGGYPGTSIHGFGGNYNDAIEDSAKGTDGTDDYGGNGGNITKEMCPLLYALLKTSFGGCGGKFPSSGACYTSTTGGDGSNGSGFGGGGGGGAVTESGGTKNAGKGGNGTDGVVIIQWKSTYSQMN